MRQGKKRKRKRQARFSICPQLNYNDKLTKTFLLIMKRHLADVTFNKPLNFWHEINTKKQKENEVLE